MKVKELLELLKKVDPESVVLINDQGSILPTDHFNQHRDYNVDQDSELEFFILTTEEWEE